MKHSKKTSMTSSVKKKIQKAVITKIKSKVKKAKSSTLSKPTQVVPEKSTATIETPNIKANNIEGTVDLSSLTFEQQAKLIFDPFTGIPPKTVIAKK